MIGDHHLWVEEAMAGRLVVPVHLMGDDGGLFLQAILILRRRHRAGCLDLKQIKLYVDCDKGDRTCWKAVHHLDQLKAEAGITVISEISCAISAGLIIAMAGDHRACCPDTDFLWHGSQAKPGFDESRMSDERRSQFMADLTLRDFDWWMEKAVSGKSYEFDENEALEIGVVHEIADDLLV